MSFCLLVDFGEEYLVRVGQILVLSQRKKSRTLRTRRFSAQKCRKQFARAVAMLVWQAIVKLEHCFDGVAAICKEVKRASEVFQIVLKDSDRRPLRSLDRALSGQWQK